VTTAAPSTAGLVLAGSEVIDSSDDSPSLNWSTMEFEPVKMERRVIKRDDPERPYVIELSPQPSAEWAQEFGHYNLPHMFPNNAFPIIVEWGIAIAELPRMRADELLESIQHAVNTVNEAEAKRIGAAPPDTREIYEKWFDENAA
jgi:hypothetical protein